MIQYLITVGDFLDRRSIWEIKFRRTGKHRDKLDQSFHQLDALLVVEGAYDLYMRLIDTNDTLWSVEDNIREAISVKDTPKIVELSTMIVQLNDARSVLKKEIDILFGDASDSKVYAGRHGYSV